MLPDTLLANINAAALLELDTVICSNSAMVYTLQDRVLYYLIQVTLTCDNDFV